MSTVTPITTDPLKIQAELETASSVTSPVDPKSLFSNIDSVNCKITDVRILGNSFGIILVDGKISFDQTSFDGRAARALMYA